MTDPMTVAIATAMAGKAVEVAGEPVRAAVAEMCRRVRERMRGRPSDEAALASADPEAVQGVVRRVLDDDPELRAELETFWNQAQTKASANDEGVVNVFNGQADRVVQLRDIKGDLNIN
ncbi:hypothetical protein E1200_06940 [Actinomadura sp. GC306]|uniref:hypothetical protein n=1 Tax=Actinomadura sp. GC306 TaxID=2530367 RepID=UPI0010527774|nr:hypothetical protein [Actinomadura sp. GC306]TDC69921.1 hypothetical protein E1200_06940 [Actinomadura sp. GC306]